MSFSKLYFKPTAARVLHYSAFITIAVFDSSTSNVTYLLIGVVDGTRNSEMFKFNRIDQLVSSSFCHISSLEVY